VNDLQHVREDSNSFHEMPKPKSKFLVLFLVLLASWAIATFAGKFLVALAGSWWSALVAAMFVASFFGAFWWALGDE
jgi:hypothetical protein